MKIFKVKAINLYGNISTIGEIQGFEEWEKILPAESKEKLLNMLSNNNQVISIEEVNDKFNHK